MSVCSPWTQNVTFLRIVQWFKKKKKNPLSTQDRGPHSLEGLHNCIEKKISLSQDRFLEAFIFNFIIW